jgi:hypothetical protein
MTMCEISNKTSPFSFKKIANFFMFGGVVLPQINLMATYYLLKMTILIHIKIMYSKYLHIQYLNDAIDT